METINKTKAFLTAVFAGLTAIFGNLAVPILIMVASNIIDYGTGLAAAPKRGEKISSLKGLEGIAKKICLWILVFIGWMMDELIIYVVATIGMSIAIPRVVAIVVTVWIICNELISILENVIDIGVTPPPFLMPLVKLIRHQTEEAVDMEDRVEEEKEE